jgi:hypothetical protein
MQVLVAHGGPGATVGARLQQCANTAHDKQFKKADAKRHFG